MKCSKCRTHIKKGAKFCPMCGTKVSNVRNRIVLFVFMCGVVVVGVFSDFSQRKISASVISEVHRNCITVSEGKITMQNEFEGRAYVTISIPDYEKLFKEAQEHRSAERYLVKCLKKGEYQKQVFERIAPVTIEDGETVVHSEEIVEELITDSLIQAVNSLTEVEK